VLSGGEPVVDLGREGSFGKGGRNQELALAALERLWDEGCGRIAVLSGGTDGEDGPTDAAGAFADAAVLEAARFAGLDPRKFLASHNSYAFFDQAGGLLKTGPTQTNVMDLRVALVSAAGV
jgi:glycerate-2-kinase